MNLIRKIGTGSPPDFPDEHDPVAVLLLSFLMWESTTDDAIDAYDGIREVFVDYNDLRVSLPYEIAKVTGQDDDLSVDRAERLRAVLNDVFRREDAVMLDHLREIGKRDARSYIESLEGITPYVSARVLLLSFDCHAIPVDEQLRRMLIREGAADESADVAELTGWLNRHVKASDARKTHFALQDWVDGQVAQSRAASGDGAASGKRRRRRRRPKAAAGRDRARSKKA